MERNETFVHIEILENEVEAQIIDAELENELIPHLMRSYHDSVLNGIYQLQKGWGYIAAPERYRKRIGSIIDRVRNRK